MPKINLGSEAHKGLKLESVLSGRTMEEIADEYILNNLSQRTKEILELESPPPTSPVEKKSKPQKVDDDTKIKVLKALINFWNQDIEPTSTEVGKEVQGLAIVGPILEEFGIESKQRGRGRRYLIEDRVKAEDALMELEEKKE